MNTDSFGTLMFVNLHGTWGQPEKYSDIMINLDDFIESRVDLSVVKYRIGIGLIACDPHIFAGEGYFRFIGKRYFEMGYNLDFNTYTSLHDANDIFGKIRFISDSLIQALKIAAEAGVPDQNLNESRLIISEWREKIQNQFFL